jgi:preprotein translocase subunit Sec63
MPAAPNPDGSQEPDLYAALGVSSVASSTEIRRAYRTLITKVRLGDPRCNSLT